MIVLPTKPIVPLHNNPRKAVFFSHTKVGKTSAVAALPNSLIIDLEDGSEFVTAVKINVVKEALKENKTVLEYLKELSQKIKESDHKYDYIVIDTATALEDIAIELATILYKKTNIGKGFTGTNVVTELPQGAGYNFLREAFGKLYDLFSPYAQKCFIVLGHVKLASVNKNGKDLTARDIQLTGKLKQMVCQGADAIGYLYRDRDNIDQVVVSFKTREDDMATGARSEHLRNQEFVLTEYNPETKTFTYNWDKIFPGWV